MSVVEDDTFLLYDGDCPFCRVYTRKSRFETRIGEPLTLIDAKEAPDLVAALRREGYDVEHGMILARDGRRYQGAAAMMALESMTSGTDRFNRLARWFSSNPNRVRILYPWFRSLRNVARWIKSKTKPARMGRD